MILLILFKICFIRVPQHSSSLSEMLICTEAVSVHTFISSPLVATPLPLSDLLSISSTITHWPQISLMPPSNILALCVTTICCVYGDMHTKLLIISCMSTQPISIHATISVCGITRLVSLQYSWERGGGIMGTVCEQRKDRLCLCLWVCVCVYLSQGATVSLRQHECGPVSVWHSSVRQALHSHIPEYTLRVYPECFGACSCILHLYSCVLCCPSSSGLWVRPVCWLATPPMPSLVNTSPLCE